MGMEKDVTLTMLGVDPVSARGETILALRLKDSQGRRYTVWLSQDRLAKICHAIGDLLAGGRKPDAPDGRQETQPEPARPAEQADAKPEPDAKGADEGAEIKRPAASPKKEFLVKDGKGNTIQIVVSEHDGFCDAEIRPVVGGWTYGEVPFQEFLREAKRLRDRALGDGIDLPPLEYQLNSNGSLVTSVSVTGITKGDMEELKARLGTPLPAPTGDQARRPAPPPAAAPPTKTAAPAMAEADRGEKAAEAGVGTANAAAGTPGGEKNVRVLKDATEEIALAEVENLPDGGMRVTVTPTKKTRVGPILETFLEDRIYKEMRRKDEQDVEAGTLDPDSVTSWQIEEEEGYLKKITVKTPDPKREREILSTARWTISRLLQ